MDKQDTQEEDVVATEAESDKEGTGTDQNKNSKTFSQEELNKIVAREKTTWKKSQDKATADHETIVDGLRKDLEKRDELIIKQVDILVQDLGLDEETLELVNGLDILERYEWVMKKVEKAGKQDIPRTPKGGGETPKSNPFKRTQTV